MTIESNKTLGGIGALLIAIGSFVPILSLVGIILVLVAMKGFADDYGSGAIWTNALYGFIFGIIGIIAAAVVLVAFVFTGVIFFPFAGLFAGLAFIATLLTAFVFLLLQAIYYRRAFTILYQKTGEKMFDTGGLLLLLGSILVIILIGFILLFIAWILLAVGFFSIRTPAAPPAQYPAPTQPQPPAAAPTQIKYCTYCGAENRADAIYCAHCGKQL
jgi:uncharacterized membrane protein